MIHGYKNHDFIFLLSALVPEVFTTGIQDCLDLNVLSISSIIAVLESSSGDDFPPSVSGIDVAEAQSNYKNEGL